MYKTNGAMRRMIEIAILMLSMIKRIANNRIKFPENNVLITLSVFNHIHSKNLFSRTLQKFCETFLDFARSLKSFRSKGSFGVLR